MGEAKSRRNLQGGTSAAASTRPYTAAIPDGIKADIASVVHGVRVAGFAPGSRR
jgi:hypothetical protein